jgi:hypothetical protein
VPESALPEKTKIAACPSCVEIARKLDPARYEIIATGSTAESIAILQSGGADMILAGRTLKPEEPKLDYYVVRDGYSLLAGQEISIFSDDLADYMIYTDQSADEIKKIFSVKNVLQTGNVYDYLGKGIIITSWENTDYSRAKIVHLYNNDGTRFEFSRRPTLYCLASCADAAGAIKSLAD